MKYDKNRPVSSIKHDDKRAAIPDSAHQGESSTSAEGQSSDDADETQDTEDPDEGGE